MLRSLLLALAAVAVLGQQQQQQRRGPGGPTMDQESGRGEAGGPQQGGQNSGLQGSQQMGPRQGQGQRGGAQGGPGGAGSGMQILDPSASLMTIISMDPASDSNRHRHREQCGKWSDWKQVKCWWPDQEFTSLPQECTNITLPKKVPAVLQQFIEAKVKEVFSVLQAAYQKRGSPPKCGYCSHSFECRSRNTSRQGDDGGMMQMGGGNGMQMGGGRRPQPHEQCKTKEIRPIDADCDDQKACSMTQVDGGCPTPVFLHKDHMDKINEMMMDGDHEGALNMVHSMSNNNNGMGSDYFSGIDDDDAMEMEMGMGRKKRQSGFYNDDDYSPYMGPSQSGQRMHGNGPWTAQDAWTGSSQSRNPFQQWRQQQGGQGMDSQFVGRQQRQGGYREYGGQSRMSGMSGMYRDDSGMMGGRGGFGGFGGDDQMMGGRRGGPGGPGGRGGYGPDSGDRRGGFGPNSGDQRGPEGPGGRGGYGPDDGDRRRPGGRGGYGPDSGDRRGPGGPGGRGGYGPDSGERHGPGGRDGRGREDDRRGGHGRFGPDSDERRGGPGGRGGRFGPDSDEGRGRGGHGRYGPDDDDRRGRGGHHGGSDERQGGRGGDRRYNDEPMGRRGGRGGDSEDSEERGHGRGGDDRRDGGGRFGPDSRERRGGRSDERQGGRGGSPWDQDRQFDDRRRGRGGPGMPPPPPPQPREQDGGMDHRRGKAETLAQLLHGTNCVSTGKDCLCCCGGYIPDAASGNCTDIRRRILGIDGLMDFALQSTTVSSLDDDSTTQDSMY